MGDNSTRTKELDTSTFWHVIVPVLVLVILLFVLFVIYTIPDYIIPCTDNILKKRGGLES